MPINVSWAPGPCRSRATSVGLDWERHGLMRLNGLLIVLLTSAAVLSACGRAVPPDKAAHVGEWRSQTVAFLVPQAGTVASKRIKGGLTTSVTAPLRRFEGDNFVVGLPLIS